VNQFGTPMSLAATACAGFLIGNCRDWPSLAAGMESAKHVRLAPDLIVHAVDRILHALNVGGPPLQSGRPIARSQHVARMDWWE